MLRFFFFVLVLLVSSPALAQSAAANVTECGVPPLAQLDTAGLAYCDIHSRRLAYSDEDIKFNKLLDERRANYHAPRQAAFSNYQEAVKARHDAYEPETTGSDEPAAEPAGPPAPGELNLNP